VIEFRADLHCHSTCSDGSLSPEDIVKLAKKVGLSGLSITDHDSVEAYSKETLALCADLGIELLTGAEFSATLEGASIHVLGYGFQPDNPHIANFCSRHIERRQERNRAILSLLAKHGMPLSEEEIVNTPPSTLHRTIGRPHIAAAMVTKGYVSTVQDAFRRYLSENKPCYAPGTPISVDETIQVIHNAKGIAVIAHPHLLHNRRVLQLLLERNFDGIECYYAKLLASAHQPWLKIAKKKQWVVTGGSDFHGDVKPDLDLGCAWIDAAAFQLIKERLQ
jgi:predicted metal-dependent phosphoesterase TrpH